MTTQLQLDALSPRSPRRILRRGIGVLAVVCLALLENASVKAAEREPDVADTLIFEATFDNGAQPTYGPGVRNIIGNARTMQEGKTGGGLAVPNRAILFYKGGASGLDEQAGKIECWLRTRWPASESQIRRVFEIDFGAHKKIKLNRYPDGRFGFAIVRPHGKDSSRAHQLRTQPWSNLSSSEWHHIELSWRGGQLEFRLDGAKIAVEADVQLFFRPKGDLKLYGSDFDIDSIRLYRGSTAGANGATRAEIEAPERDFVEPNSLTLIDGFSSAGRPIDWRAKPLLSDFNPGEGWPAPSSAPISLTLSPGRDATAAVLIAAGRDLDDLHLEVGDFTASEGTTVKLPISIFRIIRTWERTIWNGPPDELTPVARFISPWTTRDLRSSHFQEVWIRIEGPDSLIEGSYSGSLQALAGEDRVSIPFELSVRRYPLDLEGPKKLGIYYYLDDKLFNEAEIKRELADLRSHGIRYLITDLEIQHGPADQHYEPQAEMARRGLELIRQSGFDGLVVMENGLGRVMKWRQKEFEGGLAADREFARVADRTMDELNLLAIHFPELDLYQTHLDEVLSTEGLLDAYIDMARHVRRESQVPLYITLNTRLPKSDSLRQRLDPFVDYRGYHGFSFEWWLARGHRIRDLEQEHATSGDRALFYHNARGPHFTPRRSRIVNGILLWAGPFESHAPWIYQRYSGNPFDDRDGPRNDTGMAFPGPNDSIVSTRLWEATREGWIDLRHLQTLERLIAERGETNPKAAKRARQTLDTIRALVREAGPPPRNNFAGRQENERGGLYITQPRYPHSPTNESPLLSALEREFGPDGLDLLRARLAEYISDLDTRH